MPSATLRIDLADLPPLEELTPEELAEIFGAGRSPVLPNLETLESRELLASSLLASLTGGVLRIEGTEGADNIVIQQVGTEVSVRGITIAVGSDQKSTVDRSSVTSLEIKGLGGDDSILVSDAIFQRGNVDGGVGADHILIRGSGLSLTPDAADITVTNAMAEVHHAVAATRPLGQAITRVQAHRNGGHVQQFTDGDVWINGNDVQIFHAFDRILEKGTLSPYTGTFLATSSRTGIDYDDTEFLNYRNTYDVRPTLLVLTQGLNSASMSGPDRGYGLQTWQHKLAGNMARELNAAGSMVHIMKVDWASQSPNTNNSDDFKLDGASKASGSEQVAEHILRFLSAHRTQWDVTMVGFSRGGIFNAEVARFLNRDNHVARFEGDVPDSLGAKQRIRNLQLIFLDPTAAVSMGDQYPASVPVGVDHAAVYDDGYQLYPFAMTREGMPINGAEYKRVTVPEAGPFDTITSHLKLPDWYAQVRDHDRLHRPSGASDLTYQRDLAWLLGQKVQTVGEYWYESNGVGSETVIATRPNGANNVIDIGFDQNKNGDATGYISILGIGGGAFTIGKSGLNIGAGVTGYGAGSVSINNRGIGISYSGAGIGPLNFNGGVVIGVDETRLDLDVGPFHVSLFGTGAGIYIGGKKIAGLDVDMNMKPGAIRLNQFRPNGETLSRTFEGGKETLRQAFKDGKEYLRQTFVNGWETLRQSWDSTGKYVANYFSNGKEYLRETYVNGTRALRQTWSSTGAYAEQAWDKTGRAISGGWNQAKKIFGL